MLRLGLFHARSECLCVFFAQDFARLLKHLAFLFLDITLEAFEEHRLVKQLLRELEGLDKSEETWTAKFTVLKENIEHHVEEEEDEMFKKARKVLSEEDAETLGTRMEEAKAEQLKTAAAR